MVLKVKNGLGRDGRMDEVSRKLDVFAANF